MNEENGNTCNGCFYFDPEENNSVTESGCFAPLGEHILCMRNFARMRGDVSLLLLKQFKEVYNQRRKEGC